MTEKYTPPEPDKNGTTPGPKNRPWDKPLLEIALDLRTDEKVVLFTDQSSTYEYPETWRRARSLADAAIDAYSVVVFDRMDVTRKQIIACATNEARLIAICPMNVDHEKYVRRMLVSLYPWTEVYTATTAFGKVLMCAPRGQAYDPDCGGYGKN